jgi:hypothetical protein
VIGEVVVALKIRLDSQFSRIYHHRQVRSSVRDVLAMKLHGSGVANRYDNADRRSERGLDSAEDVGRSDPLMLQGKKARAVLGPASRDLVLLAIRGRRDWR